MIRFLIALALLTLAVPAAAQQPANAPPTTQFSVVFGAQQSITKLISGISGKRIYITNISIHPASTAVVTLTYGTGTNCGTGTQNFYGPATFQGGENIYDGSGAGAIFVVPTAQDVCLTITTANAPGWISYAQY